MAEFGDIVGQEQLKTHIRQALETKKVSHAYILHGEKAAGKAFIADIFARGLQCSAGEEKPCGQCKSCRQALSKNHPDIIYVAHEKPGVISVDEIRRQVVGDVDIKPYTGPYKIYIVPEADKMNVQAQNALLKTLEEPPAYAVIFLLADNAESLLPTILSRCVLLSLRPVPDRELKRFLMQTLQVPDYKADVCVAFARGNVGKAKALAFSEDFDVLKKQALGLLKNVSTMELAEMMALIKQLGEDKGQTNDFLDLCLFWYRDLLLLKGTKRPEGLIFKEEVGTLQRLAKASSYEGLNRICTAIETAGRRLESNVNFELSMEELFLAMRENASESA